MNTSMGAVMIAAGPCDENRVMFVAPEVEEGYANAPRKGLLEGLCQVVFRECGLAMPRDSRNVSDPMSTRSTYLARTLLTRAKALAGHLAEDGASAAQQRERLRELVAKVLVVEEGITEEAKVRLVLEALPTVPAGRTVSDRELQEFAAVIEARLWR